MLKGKRILVTGASGIIGAPIAQHNGVWGLARFSLAERKKLLEGREFPLDKGYGWQHPLFEDDLGRLSRK